MESNQKQEKKNNFRGKRGGRWPRGKKNFRGGYKSNNNYSNYQPYNSNYYPNSSQNNLRYNYSLYPPYMQQQLLYRTEMYIVSHYNNLIDINTKNASLSEKLNINSKFFIIKSFSEEDVHKSIKYSVWFLGLARMKSICDFNKSFELWTQDGKWMGLFDVEWLFIKDVPFKEFKDINITMKDGEIKPVSNSRDTQEIPFEQAKIMIEKIAKYQNSNTILEHFEFYDMRQDNYEKNMKMKNNINQNQPQLNQNVNNANNTNVNNNKEGNNENKIQNEIKQEDKK